MASEGFPTRAEINDIANAVFDGADGIVLTKESASGARPIDAVRNIGLVVAEAEFHFEEQKPDLAQQAQQQELKELKESAT